MIKLFGRKEVIGMNPVAVFLSMRSKSHFSLLFFDQIGSAEAAAAEY